MAGSRSAIRAGVAALLHPSGHDVEDGNPSDALALEEGIPLKAMAKLAEMGHPVKLVSGWERAIFGRGQVILRDNGDTLTGGSHPRADGCAMTLV